MTNTLTIGIDDGYFTQESKELRLKTLLVGVLCAGKKPKSVKMTTVVVDGSDGTSRALEIIEEFMRDFTTSINAVFLDGVTVAGFNFIDPEEINAKTGIPVVVLFKTKLKLEKVKTALVKHFSDWRDRYEVIERNYGRAQEVVTRRKNLRVSSYGLDLSEVSKLVSLLQHVSAVPEPLRLADMIASGLTKNTCLLNILR
ncbi:MAG: DUF99 family protein [Zestosphaera sp.]